MKEEHFLLLSAYLDGELDPTEVAEVEALLESDAEARALLAELREDVALLRGELTVDPVEEQQLVNNRQRILSMLPEPEDDEVPAWAAWLWELFTPRRLVGLGVPLAALGLVLLQPERPGLIPELAPQPVAPIQRTIPDVELRPFARQKAKSVLEVTTDDETAITTTLHLEEVGVDVVWMM